MNNDSNQKLKVSIFSLGCQMNEYDSQVAAGLLEAAGFEMVRDGGDHVIASDPKGLLRGAKESMSAGIASPAMPPRNDGARADVILLNTCSVREHAEDRVYGRLGMLGKDKKQNPNLIVGLMGCMVEEHREKLFQRFPHIDLMVGTRNLKDLPALIDEVQRTRQQVSRIKQDGLSIEYTPLIQRERTNGRPSLHAWLPIMTGCNKVCTFCIVPMTRGAEISMPAREVYREASRLVSGGVRWITLLGQNVNSYRGDVPTNVIAKSPVGATKPSDTPRHPEATQWPKDLEVLRPCGPQDDGSEIASASPGTPPHNDKGISFPDLLEMLCQIDGLERISFMTSHPSDATEELFQVIARNPKISRRFHLPLQSGSDRILKRMKRLHTCEDYKKKIERLRVLVPDISITTDIISGFSSETEDDHEATKRALVEIRYDGAYIYKYSVRPSTPAAKLEDDVPLSLKEERHHELLALQRRITIEKNRDWVGRTVKVFVEGRSPKRPEELLGETLQEKQVVFPGAVDAIGVFQTVTLLDIRNETFIGVP